MEEGQGSGGRAHHTSWGEGGQRQEMELRPASLAAELDEYWTSGGGGGECLLQLTKLPGQGQRV